MPAFPAPALDDVESANQRSFATNTQFIAAAGQRALDNATFVSTQAQLGFLALASALGLGGQLNNSILGGREVRDQPQTTGTQTSPGVQSGVPASGNTTPAQHA